MKTKGNWVIKTSKGLYWCGANAFYEQIRKAQIYHWKEYAEEQAAYIWKRNNIPADVTWEVIEVVPPQELKDTQAKWNFNWDEKTLVCSNCGYAALNDYLGNSTDSRFCPHCGKYMINSTMPWDEDEN